MNTYRCEVDLYRNGTVFRDKTNRLYDRNTAGVYLVGAKSPKEAKKILQKAIGFGSITITKHQWLPDNAPSLKHGQIVKQQFQENNDGTHTYVYDSQIRHATDQIKVPS